ncbi:MAG: triose-phosphate isomerase [Gammaproteobacteria bacterium RIFCSPLOWO2_02_FULL_61_13]|nr:MAG: triose-phosphate isomerase [Gammaproteobacteria bacterium RIFCSPLOWO2_02_FULL_61_13]
MTTRRPLVAANWKMNGRLASLRPLVAEIRAGVEGCRAEVALCVPFPYLGEVGSKLAGSAIELGAQNVSEHESGAFTGEVSAAMLRDYNCRFAVVGHSERRTLYGESDALVAAKFVHAIRSGLTAILCVGESLAERESGQTEEVVARQLDTVIKTAGVEQFSQAVVAYEPVWAIGTGRTATAEQAQEVHAFIRLRIARHDDDVADGLRIIYGGSVKGGNAKEIFAMADVDGGLIGGASLNGAEFVQICRAA